MFVRSETTAEEQGPSAAANPDEIDLDADYSSSDEGDEESEAKTGVRGALCFFRVHKCIALPNHFLIRARW